MRRMKKLYLYDPRYNIKTETNYQKLAEATGTSISALRVSKMDKNKIKKIWYIIDEKTTDEEIYDMYSSVKHENEVWKTVEGSDEEYLVSNYGRFKRKNTDGEFVFILPKSILKTSKSGRTQTSLRIWLKFRGKRSEYQVSRLVAYHYVDIYYEGSYGICKHKPEKYKNKHFDELYVIHKNGLQHDNYHGNLEYLDKEDFSKYMNSKNFRKNILLYNAHSGELIDFFNTKRQAAEEMGISETAIYENLTNKKVSNVVYNEYLFKYDNDDIDIDELVEHEIVYKNNAGISVLAIDINLRKVVAQEKSILQMSKTIGVSTPSISKSLKEDIPTKAISGRYIFRYSNAKINIDEIIEGINQNNKYCKNTKSVTVIDLKLKKVIGEYNSISETAREVGISEKAIRNNLALKDTYHAIFDRYVFRYTNSEFTIEEIIANLKTKNELGRKVSVIDAHSNEVIATYKSIRETSKNTGVSEKAIRKNITEKDPLIAVHNKYRFSQVVENSI